ncbi:MAG: post-transcriptional regulator [Bacillales bacterium]|nr:post-transcriptional regulator [Bacillales bacterium]
MKKNHHPYERYYHRLKPALVSKVEEFRLLGYGAVQLDSLWNYFIKKKWKNAQQDIRIYQLVSDIIALKPGDFMNYATVESYRSSSLLTEQNREEIQNLFHSKKEQ